MIKKKRFISRLSAKKSIIQLLTMKWSIKQWNNEWMNDHHSFNQSINAKSINQTIKRTIYQTIKQSKNHPLPNQSWTVDLPYIHWCSQQLCNLAAHPGRLILTIDETTNFANIQSSHRSSTQPSSVIDQSLK